MSATAGVITILAAGLLVAAGIAKLTNPAVTATLYGVGPPRLHRPVARLIGVAELALAGWVLIEGGTYAAATLSGMFTVFALLACWALLRAGANAACGCFGVLDARFTWHHAAVNGVGALAAVIVAGEGTDVVLTHLTSSWELRGCVVVSVATSVYALVAALGAAAANPQPDAA